MIYIFEVCFFMLSLLCGRTEEACSMVNSLRKVDFSHPTGHYTWTFFRAPLRKSWVRPCTTLSRLALHCLTLPFPLLSGSADHLRSFPAPSGNDRPFMTHPGPVRRCPALLSARHFPTLPGSVLRCRARSCPSHPCPALFGAV